jgi:glyoxylase I family protein
MLFHHICIQTPCYDESLRFYVDILGFEVLKESKDFHTRKYNTWLKNSSIMIELQTEKEDEEFIPWSKHNAGIVHMAFSTRDVKEKYTEIKNKGCSNFKLKNGEELYKVENSYLFKVKAPEGTEVEFRDVGEII